MNITQQIKRSIESRFGDGSCFTTLDFPDLSKNFSIKQIGAKLITLADNHYLKREEKVRLKIRNKPPVNRYRLAISAVDVDCVAEIPAGTITKSHSMKTPPVRPGRYGVRFWDRKESKRVWMNGAWWDDNGKSMAACFVMEWWGVTR